MTDLRKYLNEIDNAIFRPPGPVSVVQEITALQHVMAASHSNPAILVNQPKHADGRVSDIPVLTNLFASRELSARALGIDDHRDSARALCALSSKAIKPISVKPKDAPVREIIHRDHEVDLLALPALRQHEGEPGTTSRVDTSSHMTLTLA